MERFSIVWYWPTTIGWLVTSNKAPKMPPDLCQKIPNRIERRANVEGALTTSRRTIRDSQEGTTAVVIPLCLPYT